LITRLIIRFFPDLKKGEEGVYKYVGPMIENRKRQMEEEGDAYQKPVSFLIKAVFIIE
jgi:hypothetical protein